MKKRFSRRIGGFIRAKALTSHTESLYDVIAVNEKTGEIKRLGKVSTADQAKEVATREVFNGFKFYLLENNTVLTELD